MCLCDKQGVCNERSLVELPGHVDLQVILENGEQVRDGRKLAVPCCQFDLAPPEDLAILESFA